jgi:hypothetical protein
MAQKPMNTSKLVSRGFMTLMYCHSVTGMVFVATGIFIGIYGITRATKDGSKRITHQDAP